MCGIAGGTGTLPAPEILALQAALRHRGPDDAGSFQCDALWLLNTRLAIQDPSDAGHQPMRSPDGRFSLVFNGEIYNHRELRRTLLKDDTFESGSDTETLLHCWMRYGTGCLDLLDGDFAIAVYDQQRRELVLVRDRMGVKPLYWYFDGNRIAFASELHALRSLSGLDTVIDNAVFANYLLYQYNPDERTPFRRIRKLPPAHMLRIDVDELRPDIRRYYSLPFGKPRPERAAAAWETETARALEESVSSQLLSDAPLAVTLSGGLDSALVAAYARKARPERPLTGYCIDTRGALAAEGFSEDASYAKLAAKHLGIGLKLIPGDYDLGSEIDGMVLALGEPQADPAAVNIRLIAAAAKADGFSVLLSGTGADDLFSGYRRHQLLRLYRGLQYAPAPVRRISSLLAGHSARHPLIRRIEKMLGTAGRAPLQAAIHSFFWNEPATLAALFETPPDVLRQPYALFEGLLAEIPDERELLNKVLFLEQRSFLPQHNLAYMDKLSMAEGVEMRVPFADRQLVELAALMPPALKMRGSETKAVLRSIGRSLLPAEIIDRPKTGFAFPLRSWVRGSGKNLIYNRLLQGPFLQTGIFDAGALTAFIQETVAGRRDGAYTLFSLLCIESWHRQFSA